MALEGTFQDIPLADLFQIFRIGAKSGVLMLANEAERGLVYVHQGRLIDALVLRVSNREVLASGEDAVLQLLQWEKASFTFRHDIAVDQRPVRITHDNQWLVLASIRQRRAPLRTHTYQTIGAETAFELTAAPISTAVEVGLDQDQWRVLSQVPTGRTPQAISASAGLPIERTIEVLRELLAVGMVEIALPAHVPPLRRVSAQPAHSQPSTVKARSGLSQRISAPIPQHGLLKAIIRRVRDL